MGNRRAWSTKRFHARVSFARWTTWNECEALSSYVRFISLLTSYRLVAHRREAGSLHGLRHTDPFMGEKAQTST